MSIEQLRNNIINRAVEITRLYEPNSLIRERADVFVKIHILPVNELVSIENNNIKVSETAIDYAILRKSIDNANEYLNYHETGNISLGGVFRGRKVTEDVVNAYTNNILSLLRLFNGYLICRHVIDHLLWAYDELTNNSSFINYLKSLYKSEVEIDRVLNGLSKLVVSSILDFKYGYEEFIRVHKIRKLNYGEYVTINNLMNKLLNGEGLILIEANEDYFYLGIIT